MAALAVGSERDSKSRVGRIWDVAPAIVDQGVNGGANFGFAIVLARWMSPASYGEFAFAYGAVILANSVHAALVGEPLAVLERQGIAERPAAVRRSTSVHFQFCVVASVIALVTMTAIALTSGAAVTVAGACCTALAVAATSGAWYLRRLAYYDGKPFRALAVSTTYALALLCGGVVLATRSGSVSPEQALLTVAIAGALTTALGYWRERRDWDWTWPARETALAYWEYGKWALVGAFAAWFVANGFVAVFVLTGRPTSAAELRVAVNLVWPFQHMLIGVTAFLLPALARVSQEQPASALARRMSVLALQLTVAGGAYAIPVVIFRNEILGLLYGDVYAGASSVVLVSGLVPVVLGTQAAFTLALRASRRPDLYFRSYVASALLVSLLAATRLSALDSREAAGGIALAYGTLAAIAAWLFFRQVIAPRVQVGS